MTLVKPSGSKDMPSVRTLGVVLAGGKSTRMGRDKALIQYRGGTLLEHMVSLVASALEQTTAEVQVSGSRSGFNSIPDQSLGLGPLGGVSSVLGRILEQPIEKRPEYVLFIPVDMPHVSLETLKTLVSSLGKSIPAVAFEGSEMPFACRVEPWVARVALDRSISMDPSKRSVRGFHAEIGTSRISSTPERLSEFVNLNTPHDLEMALSL